MVRGMVQVPGTWCGSGATPMIAQSPVDSLDMLGQRVAPRLCRRPESHVRADRRPGALVASPTSPREGNAASKVDARDSPASKRTSTPASSSSS